MLHPKDVNNSENGLPNEVYAFPASYAQRRLWFLHRLEPNSTAYNIPAAFRLIGELNIPALTKSLQEVVRRHEILRTTFSLIDSEPKQIVVPAAPVDMPIVDLRALPQPDKESEVQRSLGEEVNHVFDLEKGPLFRASLLLTGDTEAVLTINMHHIIADGWSMPILFREIAAGYESFLRDAAPELAELPIQYADYAVWQREWLRGEVLERQVSYWKEQLAGIPAVLNLPTDRQRPAVQSFHGKTQAIELSRELSDRIKALARHQGATLFMTLLAAFQSLLHRYTGQDDIVVGAPIAGRTRTEMEGLIGFFVNTLVLRANFAGEPTFSELLTQVKDSAIGAYAHQDLPFEKLIEELRPDRDLSRAPLFQAMFSLRNAPDTGFLLDGLDVSAIKMPRETAKFDLSLSMLDTAGQLTGALQYNTDLFDGSTAERMAAHFVTLLEAVVRNSDAPIGDLSLLNDQERRRAIFEWNSAERDFPKNWCIHRMFEAQVETTPHADAVIFENQILTYRDLNHRANQLAHHLRGLGVGPEVLVGICLERSLEMVIGLLAILKAGGAYVPLDPGFPKERIEFILNDICAPILLSQRNLVERLPSHQSRLVLVDSSWIDGIHESETNPESGVQPYNLAYVMYTSGSTGKPKGVMVEHRSVMNYLTWSAELTADIRSLPFSTSVTFDASLKQIFGPLMQGKHVWILPTAVVNDPLGLLKAVVEREKTGLNCVPSLWSAVLDCADQAPADGTGLRSLFVGGEPFSPQLARRSLARFPGLEIWNLYGPTEATANAIAGKITSPTERVTLGRPIANQEAYLLDRSLQPVPIGVRGELYIGGVGLARGYLGRPELTAEKFIPHPFSCEPSSRLYKTGDLGRYLPDGSIEFLGRVDNQVKVRGFRIELGEIEAVLCRHAAVRQAVVVAREDGAEADNSASKRLIAYIVLGGQTSVNELREFVRKTVPDYMVPSAFVFLPSLPLTANGKLDRGALPVPDHQGRRESFREPRNSTEIALADIWSNVLGCSRVGLDDNFFDLGGHSLLAAKLMTLIRDELGADLPLRILFESPTIAQLAPKIHSEKRQTIFHRREQGKYAHLFELQVADKGKPIFCFPFRGGLDGEFFNFTRLARHFGPRYSFYGLLARGLDGISEPRRSVAELAADYLKEIKALQPQGPYIFVGECQGGFVAYETARQMLAHGDEMELLVLLDSSAGLPAKGWWRRSLVPLKYHIHRSPAWKYLTSRCVYHLRAVRKQGRVSAVSHVAGKAARVFSTIPYLVNLEQSERSAVDGSSDGAARLRMAALRQAFDVAVRQYTLMRYSGRVALLLNERAYNENRFQDWSHYIGKNLEVYKLPGDHDTCVPQNIPLVARILQDCLADADQRV